MTLISPVPVGEFPRSTRPFGNVQPFTYRDGATYLEVLEDLRGWLRKTLVPFLNGELTEVNTAWVLEVNALVSRVDEALETQATDVTAQLVAQAESVAASAAQWMSTQIENNDIITAEIVKDTSTLTATALFESALRVNVKQFGATPGALNNGSGANVEIQAAIDYVHAAGGGEVVIDDDFWIMAHDPAFVPGQQYLADSGGVALKDGVHLVFTSNGVLRAIPNGERRYVIVRIFNKRNVGISGPGRIIGERHEHTGTEGGEWGYGVAVTAGSDIRLADFTVTECWGDGINLQRTEGSLTDVPTNVLIERVTSDGNRRQGLSIEGARNLRVRQSIFKNTSGTLPSAGIDIEPSVLGVLVRDVVIEQCELLDNAYAGLVVMVDTANGITVRDCLFSGNRTTQGQLDTYVTDNTRNITIENNTFVRPTAQASQWAMMIKGGRGWKIRNNVMDGGINASGNGYNDARPASDSEITGNKVARSTFPTLYSLILGAVEDFRVAGNTFAAPLDTDTAAFGVWASNTRRVTIEDNTFINIPRAIKSNQDSTTGNRDLVIVSNKIDNPGIYILELMPLDERVKFSRNIVAGACHRNNGEAGINITSAKDVEVVDNTFIREPRIPEGVGVGRCGRVLSWLANLNIVINRNRLSADLPLHTAAPNRVDGGYVGNEHGLMVATTALRPLSPRAGWQMLDTTIGKLIVFDGTNWRDAAGATV